MQSSSHITLVGNLAKALSEEIRVRILLCLQGGPLALQHIQEIFSLAPSTLSKHLHILESSGLTVSVRHGRWRLYQWPGPDADANVLSLLHWLALVAKSDALSHEDSARRAVAIQNNPVPVIPKDLFRVLFLCTGNSCRSQMAEALLRERGGNRFEVVSAGVDPRDIPPLTAEVMREIGIDIEGQHPKNVMTYIGNTYFDYLISVCPLAEKHTPVFPGVTSRLHWPMEDPQEASGTNEEKKRTFRKVRDQLDERISGWVKDVTVGH